MITIKPTGRTRHRAHKPFFGKQILILQVEERHQGYVPDNHGHGDDVDQCFWRDARPEDVTTKLAAPTGDHP